MNHGGEGRESADIRRGAVAFFFHDSSPESDESRLASKASPRTFVAIAHYQNVPCCEDIAAICYPCGRSSGERPEDKRIVALTKNETILLYSSVNGVNENNG